MVHNAIRCNDAHLVLLKAHLEYFVPWRGVSDKSCGDISGWSSGSYQLQQHRGHGLSTNFNGLLELLQVLYGWVGILIAE